MEKRIYPKGTLCCILLAFVGMLLMDSECMSAIPGGFDDALIIAIFCAGISGSLVLLPELIQESLQEEENSVYLIRKGD